MKRLLPLLCCMVLLPLFVAGQGFYNHVWLTGNNPFTGFPNGRITFDSTSYVHNPEMRPMSFKGTEATICNAQGDFLMSTNGIWIANANNDTMMNGAGLTPCYLTQNWPYGIPLGYGTLFLPYPGDSSKYVLFHKGIDGAFAIDEKIVEYSIIDMTLDGGLGGVISKNNMVLYDTLSWGITACRHANGRDWWVVVIEDGNPSSYTILFTPNGIYTIIHQSFGISTETYGNVSQIMFSNDGTKFIYCTPDSQNQNGYLISSDFDRCNGLFSNFNKTLISPDHYLWGLTFSSSSEYIYTCSSTKVFQVNTDSLTVDTVAYYDGFISPPNSTCCATSFWNMYLAANGKIYITSGSSVQHIHEMNYPDSAGVACDLQQHAIDLGSYLHLRAVPNHPNYNLGPVVGSVCDTLGVGIQELKHDFHFSIAPNPVSDGRVKITYLLPQNQAGMLEVYSLTGQKVYSQTLPPWSTLQFVHLPNMDVGIYTAVIMSGRERSAKKMVVMK